MTKPRILVPGDTCWQLAQASRFRLIVDAADYFKALKQAMTEAEKTIFLIGWDFDFRINLTHEKSSPEWPDMLGPFMTALVDRKPELEIRLLKWNLGALRSLGRGASLLFELGWMARRRVHTKLDFTHPTGASHHQKIVVIDDALAFCGGIDTTTGRWDTRRHRPKDKRRNSPWGFAQGPWHDATAAIDGEAAKALGALARERWRLATGETLPPPQPVADRWPRQLAATLTDVEVAIARTQPALEGHPPVHEIEALYLAAIAAARQSIYMESQYCASRKIAEALAARLREKDGPEVVIVNPRSSAGWLEEQVMGRARALVTSLLREADHEHRFRIYYPAASDGTPIYVHAKIMIVDDWLLKVGSSNLNNRSMGFDTECDLAIEAGEKDVEVKTRIAALLDDLLAEHLAATPRDIAAARQGQSLIRTIETFFRPQGRTLRPLEVAVLSDAERELAEDSILDPERPEHFYRRLKGLFMG